MSVKVNVADQLVMKLIVPQTTCIGKDNYYIQILWLLSAIEIVPNGVDPPLGSQEAFVVS